MIHIFRLVFLILVSFLGACASNLKVTDVSDPPGAALYQGSQMFGYTPVELYYPVSDEDRKNGTKLLQ
jgi:hypothetical protein